MEKKKKVIILSVSIIALVIMVMGLSYAWYSLTLRGTKTATMTTGNLLVTLDDATSQGITITNAQPVTEEVGLLEDGYTFTIENKGTIDSSYKIYLDDLELSGIPRIKDEYVRYYLEQDGTPMRNNLLSNVGENPNRVLYSGDIKKGTTQSFKLKVWVDYDATVEAQGTALKGEIRVVATQKQVQSQPATRLLKGAILAIGVNENPATLTTTAQGSNEKGLYMSTDTNDGRSTYYFRGAVTNNYVSFAGKTWRIIRINEDGTIRIMLEASIGGYIFNSNYSNYTYMYYTNSQVKTTIDNWYTTNIGNNPVYDSKVARGDYFCEQAKVKYGASFTSGNATMTVKESYTPNFKCATDGNNKGVVNGKIGLMTVDEAWHAGGYPETADTTFYMYKGSFNEWTMSPAGFYSTYAISWTLYNGFISNSIVNGTHGVRPVLNLNFGTLVSGNGTQSSPYVVG